MMKGKAMKIFGLTLLVGLIFASSLWARQIVTEEDREWAKETIAQEKELAANVIPNTIAVLYFNNLTDLQELNPVEKGMAIMLITDLAKLQRFQVVERVRIQALSDELQLGQLGFGAPEAKTRMGRLLGAEHVVGGDIVTQRIGEFKVDSDLLDVPTESIAGNPQAQGKLLAELFKMEKELLFAIIRDLDIHLTSEEEEELQKPITDNLQAFLYLVQGIEYSDRGENQKAQESFEKAMNEDPDLTLADSLMAEIKVVDMTVDKAEAYSALDESSVSEAIIDSAADNQEDFSVSGDRGNENRRDPIDPNVREDDVDQDNDGYADNQDCNDNNPSINPGADDSNCDGVDNDCSGIPDDGYVSTPTDCGVGACAATGFISCVNGSVVDTCVAGPPSADDNCNGLDENCNGVPDDGYVSQATECGTGACYAEGSTSCVNGTVVDSCVAKSPASDDNCNGLDENCNGIPDDEFVSQATECGTGACYAEGATSCVNGRVVDTCVAGTPKADNNCNGIDDNCDGVPDDDYLVQITECGTGACYAKGSTSCVNGEVYNSCVEGTPTSDNNCDGIDDNCNGVPDDTFVSQATECGVGACLSEGFTSCVDGVLDDSCMPGEPIGADDNCNGIDENCNGANDEDYVGIVTTCGISVCENSVSTSCVNGNIVDPLCVPLPPSPEICDDGIDNNCNEVADEGCNLVPPLVSVDSINMAHENMFNDPKLESDVFNGVFFPRSFQVFPEVPRSLTEAFDYFWDGNPIIYGILGREFNQLGAWSTVDPILEDDPNVPGVDQLFSHTLGHQTLGSNDGIPVEILPAAVIDQINSDPFLAYAVQVEEDRLNQEILTLHQGAAQAVGNVGLNNDLDIVMQDVMAGVQDANYIRARDAFLLQKADAQSGRVLMDTTGTWVRTQQYILRPDDNTVQILNVSLRGPSGTGADPGIHSMELRTTLTAPVGANTDLRDLPWSDWLNTQGPNLPTSPNMRYINLPGGNYELAGMEVTFTDPTGAYLKESRTFFANIVDVDLGSIQEIDTETLDLRMGTIFDNPVGQPRTYTTDWTVVAPNEYWVADPEDPQMGGWNFTGGSSTSPPLFAYMHRTGAGASWQNLPILALVQTTVVGDADTGANQGQSPNDYSGQPMKDIWDTLRTNEPGGPQIGTNNLQIRIFGTDVWDVNLPANNWQSNESQIITVLTPMSRMVWKPIPL